MRVFVAGATGAIGRQLVPQLVAAGHEVVGTTRSAERGEIVRGLGGTPVVCDALDAEATARAVREASPEVVIHELTGLSGGFNPRDLAGTFTATNRLRTTGTDNLLAAARAAGVRRFIAQSFAGYAWSPGGLGAVDEEEPRDPESPAPFRALTDPMDHLESAVTGADWCTGIALRYGFFYGPGTSIGTEPDGEQIELVRKRRLPIIGAGTGTWSFIHVADAAGATVAALDERVQAGIYNVTDDEPAPVREWLPGLADALGARAPMRVPRWLGRIAGGAATVAMMNDVKGQSNAKARRELDWELRYPSWRQGFRAGLSANGAG